MLANVVARSATVRYKLFWIFLIFLVSLNVFFISNFQNNYLVISSLMISLLLLSFLYKKLKIQNELSRNKTSNQFELILIWLSLFFFILSRIFEQFEIEFLIIGSIFGIIKFVISKKEEKSGN